ncbi:MAG: UvrB/UvrC motif-containing protein [Planctomycetes bacterium]|jgi:protein arginine kinase activator|nr:UvrB/UvrC motif-containing protein [Planctomycetota bacterium]
MPHQPCQVCGKEAATVHLTEIEKGKQKEVHLCEACAQKQGVVSKAPSLQDILQGMIQKQMKEIGEEGSQQCPFCGIRFGEFRTKGRLGCARDYEVFRAGLAPLIEKVQGGATQHRGRVPSRAGAEVAREMRLRALRATLEEHVRKEDYEAAAKVRDELRKLEATDAD